MTEDEVFQKGFHAVGERAGLACFKLPLLARHPKECLDGTLHAARGSIHAFQAGAMFGGLPSLLEGQLESTAEYRERCSELVTRIAQKHPFSLENGFVPVNVLLQAPGEETDLVVVIAGREARGGEDVGGLEAVRQSQGRRQASSCHPRAQRHSAKRAAKSTANQPQEECGLAFFLGDLQEQHAPRAIFFLVDDSMTLETIPFELERATPPNPAGVPEGRVPLRLWDAPKQRIGILISTVLEQSSVNGIFRAKQHGPNDQRCDAGKADRQPHMAGNEAPRNAEFGSLSLHQRLSNRRAGIRAHERCG